MSDQMRIDVLRPNRMSRRQVLKAAAGIAAGTAYSASASAADEKSDGRVVSNGRIRQSIVHWCFSEHWDIEQTARIAKQLGCVSIELVAPDTWPTLKKYGLTCAIAPIDMSPDPPFVKGFNNPKYQPRVIEETRKAIDAAADFGVKNVISFTGMREDISDDEGVRNCVAGYKKIIGHAEKKKVNICLEMLNTRDDTHPMKGHPVLLTHATYIYIYIYSSEKTCPAL